MARIRTVKPELWTDPEFTECSLSARLLLIAMFNFASDYGVLPDKPRQLKMQCLPADNCDVDPLLDELLERQFVVRRLAPNGEKVLVIRTFTTHQKINRPSPGRWGNPAEWSEIPGRLTEGSVNAHGGPPPGREGKGRDNSEGKGREQLKSSSVLTVVPDTTATDDDDDFERVIATIVDAKVAEYRPTKPRAYRAAVRQNTIAEDGELIRRMLTDGDTPEAVALFVLGHGKTAEKERTETAWCEPDCPHCIDGNGWIRTDNGLAPCPGRPA